MASWAPTRVVLLAVLCLSAARAERATAGLQALYTFDEGEGDVVHDRSGHDDPLDLRIGRLAAVAWEPGALTVRQPVRIAGAGPAGRLVAACRQSQAITIEAWVAPADRQQLGPARLVAISTDPLRANAMLGQRASGWEARVRTSATGPNGSESATVGEPAVTVEPELVHVVYTRSADEQARLFVNGAQVHAQTIPGDFSNWDPSYRIGVANEIEADRPWRGELHLVALYGQALGNAQVVEHYRTGRVALAAGATPPLNPAPTVLYAFDAREGGVIPDRSAVEPKLDLVIADPAAVEWRPGALRVNRDVRAVSAEPATKLIELCRATNELTIEAWVKPANTELSGPARIVTVSLDGGNRNLTLAQERDSFVVRLRTNLTGPNGTEPQLVAPQSVPVGPPDPGLRPCHVVYTRAPDGQAVLYYDGQEIGRQTVTGDLSTWDESMPLSLCNEPTGDRPWRGRIHLIAIYDRALGPEEVAGNYAAGPD